MALFLLQGDPFSRPKKKKERPEERPAQPAAPSPSGPYKILIRPEAQQEFDALPANVQDSVTEIFERLKSWPEVSGVKPLFGKGYAPNKFRAKTWDWRVEFIVNPAIREITIIRIGHRDSFYDVYH
jgi:mRNA-degrading endonuclease RelE of RelBE toxin-antitoxin system